MGFWTRFAWIPSWARLLSWFSSSISSAHSTFAPQEIAPQLYFCPFGILQGSVLWLLLFFLHTPPWMISSNPIPFNITYILATFSSAPLPRNTPMPFTPSSVTLCLIYLFAWPITTWNSACPKPNSSSFHLTSLCSRSLRLPAASLNILSSRPAPSASSSTFYPPFPTFSSLPSSDICFFTTSEITLPLIVLNKIASSLLHWLLPSSFWPSTITLRTPHCYLKLCCQNHRLLLPLKPHDACLHIPSLAPCALPFPGNTPGF